MTYYISDTHFGHGGIIRSCERPFETAEEMDETLISNWNSRVKEADNVYILGDMFYRCKDPDSVLRGLKGRKHLILGNHDASWLNEERRAYFESIDEYMRISDGKRSVTLCHYPMISYYHGSKENSFMVHGHIHNNTRADYFPLLAKRERVLNAGVEVNGYIPVAFEELQSNNDIFKEIYLESASYKDMADQCLSVPVNKWQ